MNIKEVHNYLISHDIKPSMPRVAIMQYLMEHKIHPTIDQIFIDLLPEAPSLSKTTVYNTLKLFYDKKVVLALTIDEKNVRYDILTSNHAHFKCKTCGNIYDVPLDESNIPAFKGDDTFSLEETQVYFLGTCKYCKE